ncbi:hypothetical protein ACFYV7_24690 [Nocardia suismassiliense]|uniref:ADP ribosyltransferase domain-containing protein n=1 Tax=Nocardia suismassiliense TaxID=2077092 RepID=A0ABW6QXM9_9NOCA
MAGSYEDARQWAASYDRRATEILKMVEKVATAAHSYAIVLNEMGYQRALDEHGATIDAGPAPVKPPKPMYPVLSCRVPLPSAGGPGQGLVDEGLGLVEKIGLTIPDGNATTISNAGLTWDSARTSEGAAAFPGILEAGAVAFQDVIAPEAAFIDEDLRALKAAAEQVLTAMGDLAQSCRDHRAALDELRTLLKQQLEMVRDALIQELAITAAISVASSFITFGAGAAIGLAGAAAICARYARPMRVIIENWQTARNIRAGVKFDQDLSRAVQECKRLEELAPNGVPKIRRATTPAAAPLTQAEIDVLKQGINDPRGNSLSRLLRKGEDLTPAQAKQIEDLTKALEKLPKHEGPVVRHTNMRPESLDEFVPNQPYSDKGFMSTSNKPEGSNETLVNNSKVEMRIVSKTGREYSQYGTPDEILFPPNTNFMVHEKIPLADGRIRITMSEI